MVCSPVAKLYPHDGQTVTPFFTSVPHTGQGRVLSLGRVTSQTTPRITSTNAQKTMMIATPMPAPTACALLQSAALSVPQSLGVPLELAIPAMTQIRNKILMIRMTQLNGRHFGMMASPPSQASAPFLAR